MATPASLEARLVDLEKAINNLPEQSRTGCRDAPIAKHLAPSTNDGVIVYPTHEEGPYYAFNRGWERVFSKKPNEPATGLYPLITRGRHGVILAHSWAKHFAAEVEADQKQLILLRVEQLLLLIQETIPWIINAKAAKSGKNEGQAGDSNATSKAKKELTTAELRERAKAAALKAASSRLISMILLAGRRRTVGH
ncbi:hypothetical protein MIND_01336300 [Mycena indigotica]|uniref:Uncharacterized protein n=1 Tax=Mycena indigotica TaxID=2126181 RepID=A0A8H6S0I9_9AGAR|nr:uncharacterized protein MIND_01336300 [Mycena indigotica]KAF7290227.1 hypothetical protein MIND_01336300 [Mycena indigotica]